MEYREYSFQLPERQATQLSQLAGEQDTTPERLAGQIIKQYLEEQAALARRVYDALQKIGGLLLEYRPEDGAVIVRSPLQHRHRPALRTVATFSAQPPYVGQLRLSLRDNAIGSLRRFQLFADNWVEVDGSGVMVVEEGRITRQISRPDGLPEDQLPGYIGAYISAFSRAAQLFMETGDLSDIGRLYRELLGRGLFE